MLNRIQVRWLTWPLHNSPLLPFKNSLVAFAVCFGSLSICTVKRRPMSSEAFGWIWADNMPETLQNSSCCFCQHHIINKYKRTSSTGSHTCPRHDTTTTMLHWWGGILGSWAVPFLLHTLLFPSLWYKLILVSSVHRMLFQNCEGFLDVVWQTLIWPSCFWGSPMVYILWWTLCIHSGEVFSWLLTLTHIHLPPGECSWSGQLLWRVFSSPGKELFGHPPQLFSVVFRVFWCCWAHRCVPSF